MPISRQRKYQIKHKVLGLCYLCPEKTYKANLCCKHYEKHLERCKISGMKKRRAAGIKPRRQLRCSFCNQLGHNKATCLMEKGNDN